MYFPKGIEPGSVYEEMVQNIDFAPTFLELAGIDLSGVDEMDGVSLKHSIAGSKDPVHDNLFFEIGFARGVMTKDWKYITVRYDEKAQKQIAEDVTFTGWNGHTYKKPYYIRNTHLGYHAVLMNPNYFESDQLYDLKNDPTEKQNIFEENPEKSEEMKQILIEKLSSFPGRPYGELIK